MSATKTAAQQPLYARLWFQVIVGIVAGVLLGYFYPARGAAMKPLGDGFIKLIKMLIAPIVFGTVVVGIAQMGDMKEVGRIGLRALVYFEVVSTLALVIGLVVVNVLQPGAGSTRSRRRSTPTPSPRTRRAPQHLTHRRLHAEHHPDDGRRRVRDGRHPAGAALLGAVRSGAAARSATRGSRWSSLIDQLPHALFGDRRHHHDASRRSARSARWRSRSGSYGIGTLVSLGKLMAASTSTCLLFIFVVLGAIAWLVGLQPHASSSSTSRKKS